MSVPKLRFKREDGTDYPEWASKHISEFANCFAGATPSTKVKAYWENGTISWLSSGEVNKKQIFETDKRISQLGFEKCSTKMVKPNSVVMALAGQGKTRGTVAITRIPVCTNQSLCAIETDDSIVDDYLYQYLRTRYDDLRNISSGDGTRGGLNLKLINDYLVSVPCLEEQQKIADFLSTVDEVIAQSEAEVQNLEQQKKAAMQKIFSQEVRFKREDGTEYPAWEESTIENEMSFINGKAHENCEDNNGNYIIVNSKYISTNGKVARTTNTILEPLYINDIVMVMSDVPNGKAIAKCLVIECDNKFTLNQRICALRSAHNPYFIANQISRCKYFLAFDDGAKQTNLKKQDILDCPIFIASLEEQQKIADFLSAYDEAISYAKQELDKWKELKKGLLQQMFV